MIDQVQSGVTRNAREIMRIGADLEARRPGGRRSNALGPGTRRARSESDAEPHALGQSFPFPQEVTRLWTPILLPSVSAKSARCPHLREYPARSSNLDDR